MMKRMFALRCWDGIVALQMLKIAKAGYVLRVSQGVNVGKRG